MILKHSSGGIVINGDKVLTISWTTHDYITFPKGGVDEGETIEQAAVREVFEETGYRTNIVAPLGSWTYDFEERGESYRKQVDYFLMELADNAEPTPHREKGEDFENLWLDISVMRDKLSFDDTKEAFDAALRLR